MTTGDRACRNTLDQISAYLDSELDRGTCDAVEAHCRKCAACRRVLDGLRGTVGLCRRAGEAFLPPEVRARAQERVRELLARADEPGD